MAQDFSLRYMLVDGQGNFGSVDGDNAAAMRYTEIRLSKIAHSLLEDLDKDTVDFRPNFDESLEEPTVMPAKIPNLLVNGASGIAVGMATNMAPHNLSEVCDGVCAYIDNNDITIPELMQQSLFSLKIRMIASCLDTNQSGPKGASQLLQDFLNLVKLSNNVSLVNHLKKPALL
jgi:hypothetical protein